MRNDKYSMKSKKMIDELPKIELHVHLEGSIRYETLVEFSRKMNNPLSDKVVQTLKEIESYRDLSHFITTIRTIGDLCINCPEDYERIAYELFCDLNNQNVYYVEVSYDISRSSRLGFSIEDTMRAVSKAKSKAELNLPIKIGLIIGLNREQDAATILEYVNLIIEKHKEYDIIGIDLHGNETEEIPSKFKEAFDLAYTSGLGIRIHAGENMSSRNVWDAVTNMKATRIGHGIGAASDDTLLDFLKKNNVVLDVCPSSNLMLGIIGSIEEHPIKKLYEYGVHISISTDDPLYFNTDLNNEYYMLYSKLGFLKEDFRRINILSVEGSFAEASLKKKLIEKLNQKYDEIFF